MALLELGLAAGSAWLAHKGQKDANKASQASADQATAASQAMAREQMAWQERMDNTKRQRDVTDLRAAGLNPLLAATYGFSAPSGAHGTAHQATHQSAGAPAVHSAVEAARFIKERSLVKTQVAAANAELQARADKAAYDSEVAKLNERFAKYDAIASRIKRDIGTVGSAAAGIFFGSKFRMAGAAAKGLSRLAGTAKLARPASKVASTFGSKPHLKMLKKQPWRK